MLPHCQILTELPRAASEKSVTLAGKIFIIRAIHINYNMELKQ